MGDRAADEDNRAGNADQERSEDEPVIQLQTGLDEEELESESHNDDDGRYDAQGDANGLAILALITYRGIAGRCGHILGNCVQVRDLMNQSSCLL